MKGSSFERLGPDAFALDATSRSDLERLVSSAYASQAGGLRGVVHLWSLDESLTSNDTLEALHDSQERSCASALHLCQVMATGTDAAPARIALVTSRAQPVPGDRDGSSLGQSPLWGLGRVVRLEHPELRCVNVDLGLGRSPESARRLLDEALLAEDGEHQLAIREGGRFVLRVTPSDASHVPKGDVPELDPEGTYVITGGLGGLGILVARWMVEAGARDLVLLGRGSPSQEATEAVRAMEHDGARIKVAAVDVADRDALGGLLATVRAEGRPLRGVVHAAGVLDDGGILQQTWERFRRVMASKVDGTWNLHQLTQSDDLEFLLLFSSGASFLGSPGQSNHAAANAFMDELAHHRRAQGLPALSINWGAWRDLGAAVRTGVIAQAEAEGRDSIGPDEGLQVLGHLMSTDSTQVGVIPMVGVELAAWARHRGQGHFYDELAGSKEAHLDTEARQAVSRKYDLRDRLAGSSPGRWFDLVLEAVQTEAAYVMGLADDVTIDPRQPLTDLGLDSLMAVELRNAIGALVDDSLPATLLFNYPSVEALAEHLMEDVLALAVPAEAAEPAAPAARPEHTNGPREEQLDELSEDEVAELLTKKLWNAEGQVDPPARDN